MEAQHEAPVTALSCSVDTRVLTLGMSSGTVGMLDVFDHKYQTILRSHSGAITFMKPRPPLHDEFLTLGADCSIRLWDAASGLQKIEFNSPLDVPLCGTYHPEVHVIAVGFQSGVLRIFDVDTISTLHERKSSNNSPLFCVIYSKIGDALYTLAEDYTLTVYDEYYLPSRSVNLSLLNTSLRPSGPFRLCVNGDYLVASSGTSSSITIVDLSDFSIHHRGIKHDILCDVLNVSLSDDNVVIALTEKGLYNMSLRDRTVSMRKIESSMIPSAMIYDESSSLLCIALKQYKGKDVNALAVYSYTNNSLSKYHVYNDLPSDATVLAITYLDSSKLLVSDNIGNVSVFNAKLHRIERLMCSETASHTESNFYMTMMSSLPTTEPAATSVSHLRLEDFADENNDTANAVEEDFVTNTPDAVLEIKQEIVRKSVVKSPSKQKKMTRKVKGTPKANSPAKSSSQVGAKPTVKKSPKRKVAKKDEEVVSVVEEATIITDAAVVDEEDHTSILEPEDVLQQLQHDDSTNIEEEELSAEIIVETASSDSDEPQGRPEMPAEPLQYHESCYADVESTSIGQSRVLCQRNAGIYVSSIISL